MKEDKTIGIKIRDHIECFYDMNNKTQVRAQDSSFTFEEVQHLISTFHKQEIQNILPSDQKVLEQRVYNEGQYVSDYSIRVYKKGFHDCAKWLKSIIESKFK